MTGEGVWSLTRDSTTKMAATPFVSETLCLEMLDMIQFMHLSDNSKQNEFQGPPKLFKMFQIIQKRNDKFKNLYLLNQNIVTDKSLALWKGHHWSFR
jgi:hypothetical protein